MGLLDATLGALEIGVLMSIFLFGIATVQVFIYSQSNFKDSLQLRFLVGLIYSLETIHSVCICALLYSLTVVNYGVATTIADAPWSLDLSAVLSAWIGAIIQAFFTYRVKVLSGRLVIPIMIWTLSLSRASLGIMIGVVTLRSKTLTKFIDDYPWLVTTQLVLGAVIDVLNTSSICFYLLRRRSNISMSHKLVDRIVIWSIETGMVTSVTAVAMMICAIAMPHNLVYIGILMPYAKMFSNSLFASLNARRWLRQSTAEVVTAGKSTGSHFKFVQNRAKGLELSEISAKDSKSVPSTATFGGTITFDDGMNKC